MRRKYALLTSILLLVLAFGVVSCGTATPEPQEQPTEAPAPEPTATEAMEAEPTETEAEPSDSEEETAEDGEPFRVAFVYVAPIGDLGWTWTHEQGRLAIEEEFGDAVETAFVENVPEGPESERDP